MNLDARKKQVVIRRGAIAYMALIFTLVSLVFISSNKENFGLIFVISVFIGVVAFLVSTPLVSGLMNKEATRAKSMINSFLQTPARFEHEVFHVQTSFKRSFWYLVNPIIYISVVLFISYSRDLPWPLVLLALIVVLGISFGFQRKFQIENGHLKKFGRNNVLIESLDLKTAVGWRDYFFSGKVLLDSEGQIVFELPGNSFDSKILDDYITECLVKIT